MYFHTIFLTILFTLITLTASLDATDTKPNSLGPVPISNPVSRPISKAPLVPMIFTGPDTNLTAPSDLTRRETRAGTPANLNINIFSGNNCEGLELFGNNIIYSTSYNCFFPWQSFMLSRGLEVGEQLDFSGPPNCNNFFGYINTQIGTDCYWLDRPVTCVRLWHY